MQNYMLDTNIFGKLKREGLDQNSLRGVRIFVTHNQIDEIKQIQDVEKRNQLMEILQQAGSHEAQTSSFLLDVSILNKAKLSGKNSPFNAMLTCLKQLDATKPRTSMRGYNQVRDVLIAETAIKEKFTLVTNDKNLAKVTQKFGGRSINFRTLRRRLDRALRI